MITTTRPPSAGAQGGPSEEQAADVTEEPDELEQLKAADPVTRARRSSELLAFHQDAVAKLSPIRRQALLELVSDRGMSHQQIADLLKTTRGRVSQILNPGVKTKRQEPLKAERLVLGNGPLTVAIGGKWEADKKKPSAMVSSECLAAYQLIADAARERYGLEADRELVPPPGMVQLNRSNLVVLGSPRILPLVAQVLDSDRGLGFESDSRGWYLRDKTSGDTYRSDPEKNDTVDYGYIGRLPRPDGQGTFLYIAGIHAMGTLGAARFLVDNTKAIYRSAPKAKPWSMLVGVKYDSTERRVHTVEALTDTRSH